MIKNDLDNIAALTEVLQNLQVMKHIFEDIWGHPEWVNYTVAELLVVITDVQRTMLIDRMQHLTHALEDGGTEIPFPGAEEEEGEMYSKPQAKKVLH